MISIKTILFIVLTAFGLASIGQTVDAASTLQIRPLLVNEKLEVAESKKGYIDIANPADTPVTVDVSIEAFRQIDDDGSLEFYKSKEISAGLIPDLEQFELGPRESLRMYYLVDGRKLPEGDVFGAIFFTTKESSSAGIGQSARVGSLITLVNGTPGSRALDLDLSGISPIQLGEAVKGRFTLRNPANPETTSGFFPEISLQLRPFELQKQVDGPLLMAGNSRQVSFSLPTNRIGFYKFTIEASDTIGTKWLFVMTGWGRLIVPILVVILVIILVILRRRKRCLRLGFKKRP